MFSPLKPGVHVNGHHIVGSIPTVVNSDYLEPRDCEIKKKGISNKRLVLTRLNKN